MTDAFRIAQRRRIAETPQVETGVTLALVATVAAIVGIAVAYRAAVTLLLAAVVLVIALASLRLGSRLVVWAAVIVVPFLANAEFHGGSHSILAGEIAIALLAGFCAFYSLVLRGATSAPRRYLPSSAVAVFACAFWMAGIATVMAHQHTTGDLLRACFDPILLLIVPFTIEAEMYAPLAVLGVACAVVGAVQFFGHNALFGMLSPSPGYASWAQQNLAIADTSWIRAHGPFVGPTYFAAVLAATTVASTTLLLTTRRRTLVGCALLLQIGGGLLSFSRTYAVFAALGVFALFLLRSGGRRLSMRLVLMLIAGAALSIALATTSPSVNRAFQARVTAIQAENSQGSFSGRSLRWNQALREVWPPSPIGPRGSAGTASNASAHNVFLDVALYRGWVALAALLALLVFAFQAGLKQGLRRYTPALIALVGAGFFVELLADPAAASVVWMLVGALLASREPNQLEP